MNKFTYNQALREINKEFKSLGLQLKGNNSTHNGVKLYKILDRDSGEILGDNFTLWSTYENLQSGYFETLV